MDPLRTRFFDFLIRGQDDSVYGAPLTYSMPQRTQRLQPLRMDHESLEIGEQNDERKLEIKSYRVLKPLAGSDAEEFVFDCIVGYASSESSVLGFFPCCFL
jgi:hypothetical protein